MQFKDFKKDLPAILEKDDSIVRNFQAEWKKTIIREINYRMPLDQLNPEDDLTQFAMFQLLTRYYLERGGEGFNDIVKFWAGIINKYEDEKERLERKH